MKLIGMLLLGLSGGVLADEATEGNGDTNTHGFPWQLVIERGKINGCIYDNTFYSSGSILIEETLPRKCKIDSGRDGYWAELDERELELFEASVRAQQELEKESLSVGSAKISKKEAAMLRLMRTNTSR